MRNEHFESDPTQPSGARAFPRLASISDQAIADFCSAVEFAVHHHPITRGELADLRQALRALAREAHTAHLQPEVLLLGVRQIWSQICGNLADPDMHDADWDLVVRECLDAYEAERP